MSKQPKELLRAYDLNKCFQSPGGELKILKGIHFTVHEGEMVYILGRSGSGKSTFLNLLGGLDKPTDGKILFEGQDMSTFSEKGLAKLRNTRIGLVFQFYHLLPELTVYENVLLPSMIMGRPNASWARECLRKVQLYSRAEHYPSELSGGEKQRAAIARALINQPSIVLCDEPTGNLDEDTAGSVLSLMKDLNQRDGQAFIIVTHDRPLAHSNESVYRLIDGVLLPENQYPVDIEKLN